jgi:branched-chain amino acid transport system permease protein
MPTVGVDEWVAQEAERRSGYRGLTAPVRRRWDALPAAARLGAAVALAALVPVLSGSDYVVRVGVNTLLLALLALGLNVVVGWAGLLDLGYIAFYGFGAYGYALLASDQLGVHLPALAAVPVVVVAAAALGLLLGLPSRRLLGDYLAIVTLFFGQVFVELVLNLDRVTPPGASAPISLTGGPDGIPGVDPMAFFGLELLEPAQYFYLLLALAAVLLVALHLADDSRVGRAWRAVREDPLAAELMTIPVNRVKLLAFAVGAGIAGLAGSVFAAVQIGVFPNNFETSFLILIYAAVILGGSGSLVGAALGAVVVSVTLELLRNPTQASLLFYGVVLLTLVARLRPWRRLLAVLAGVVALGLVVRALAGAASSSAVAGRPHAAGWLSSLLDAWVVVPAQATSIGNVAFVALVLAILGLTLVRGRLRAALLVPVLYLAAFVWETRLVAEPSVTRQLLLGALLVVLMNARPHGLLGERRVEVI